MRIIVLDLETTVNSEREGDVASPFDPNNRTVAVGIKTINNGDVGETVTTYIFESGATNINLHDSTDPVLLVGHNIKFDIHYLRKHGKSVAPWLDQLPVLQVWDTQLAEYLLTGMSTKMCSLDQVSAKYGGTLKDEAIKEYWKAGVKTEDIPKDELLEYLEADVDNTYKVFVAQVQQAKALGMLPLIRTQMDALLAVQEMEYNGMYIDQNILRDEIKSAEYEIELEEADVLFHMKADLPKTIRHLFNPMSNKQLGWFFFGGTISYKLSVETGNVFKGGPRKGEKKTRLEQVEFTRKPICKLLPDRTPKGSILFNEDTINKLMEEGVYEATKILHVKKLKKLLGTYLTTTLDLTWKHDNYIHHQLNQCLTATGRLSSSKPNLQNVSNEEGYDQIKKAFVSRYGMMAGVLLEIDYSQLEVRALAQLTKDPTLINDLLTGVDMHTKIAMQIYNCSEKAVTKAQRTKAKVGTFSLQYGAGIRTVAKQSKLTELQAKRLIDSYYKRYHTIKLWHAHTTAVVQSCRVIGTGTTEQGYPAGEATISSITGRRYHFVEFDAPVWLIGKETSFSPTQIKNYPVQGLATGDIVPMMMGKVLRNVMPRWPEVKMINTIHDSILFDCPIDNSIYFAEEVKREMERVSEYLLEIFDIDSVVPYTVTVATGNSWKVLDKE